jgi:hypothetical protein
MDAAKKYGPWVLSAAMLACVGVAQAASSTITGFGATNAAWNRTHAADHRFAPGAVYNPDPAIPSGDHYAAVIHQYGHVTSYEYRFTPRSIAAAKRLVLQTELPSDSHLVWFVSKTAGGCSQMLVRSKRLARAIGKKPIGDTKGTVFIEFGTGVGGLDAYNVRSISDALLTLYGLVPRRDAPPC